jgi:hypothetical protein
VVSAGPVAYWGVEDADEALTWLLAAGAQEHTPIQDVWMAFELVLSLIHLAMSSRLSKILTFPFPNKERGEKHACNIGHACYGRFSSSFCVGKYEI